MLLLPPEEGTTMNDGSTRALTRRAFTKAVAGLAVVGYQAGSGSWVLAGGEPKGGRFDKPPQLDGTLLLDEASRRAYAQDFGQIVSEKPDAVLLPGSENDIARMLRFARRHGVRVVGRGTGHTTFGQSQHRAGLVFDLTSLDHIGPVVDDTITVGAGCRWNAVLPRTLADGMMPPVLPDYIGQTVGGTLSVGGIGAMSFREGAQIDHVVALRAVTGDGRIVDCSAGRHRELFEMLLAGQGQVGVIVEATLRLVAAPSTVRVYDLVYPDLDSLLTDLTTLMDDERFDQMESFIIPTGPGSWLYLLEAIGFHTVAGPPDDATLLEGLGHVADQSQTGDLDFLTWSSRVPTNLPKRPNPWIDLLLPMSGAASFLEEVQATIEPVGPGDSFSLLLIPLRASRFTRPLFRTQDEELGLGFDTLRALPPGTDPKSALAFNRRLYDRCRRLGGSQYPISAVRLDVEDWKAHYGEQWDRLRAAKRRYDRDDVLASGPDVLGRAQR
jgi:FAD/FMN-containing dehydrogenase